MDVRETVRRIAIFGELNETESSAITERVVRLDLKRGEELVREGGAEEALQRSEGYLAEAEKLTHTGSWAWDPRTEKVLYAAHAEFVVYLFQQIDRAHRPRSPMSLACNGF